MIYKRVYHLAKQSLYKQKIIKSTKENEMLNVCLSLDEDWVNEISYKIVTKTLNDTLKSFVIT